MSRLHPQSAPWCGVCHHPITGSYSRGCYDGKHPRAEQIVRRLVELAKYTPPDLDNPTVRAAMHETAALLSEWWALPAAEIDHDFAKLSPSFNRCMTGKGHVW